MIIPEDYCFDKGETSFWVFVTDVDASNFHWNNEISYFAEIRAYDKDENETVSLVERPKESFDHPDWDNSWWKEIENDLEVHYVEWGPEESPVHDSDFLPRRKA